MSSVPRHALLILFSLFAGMSPAHAGEVCLNCLSDETIQSRFEPPPGFTRVSADSGFSAWLRDLRLLPPDRAAHDWRGNSVFRPEDVAGVLDWRLLGEVEQCADVAIRLVAEYLEMDGRDDRLVFRSLSGQAMDWRKWLAGTYAVDDGGGRIVYRPATHRSRSRAEFDRYLSFVMTYANTASLRADWEPLGEDDIQIGDVLIQPGCPGTGMGHLSMIVDACEDPNGQRLYLFIDGYTPARVPVVRQSEPGNRPSAWMTVAEYQALQSQFGVGEFYRAPFLNEGGAGRPRDTSSD